MNNSARRIMKITGVLVLSMFFLPISCTDLDEDTFGVVTPETFFRNESEAVTGLVPVYASLRSFYDERNIRGISEVTSDEIVVPARPGWGWEDGGLWLRLAEHNWTPQHSSITGTYNNLFSAIARANSFLYNLDNSDAVFDSKEQLIAETRFLRAFFYANLVDLYGNVPIVTQPLTNTDELPSNDGASNRKQVAQFVVDELNEVIPLLPTQQIGENFGRATKGAAQMLLARMYLNANIYFETGSFSDADLQKVVALATEVIDSGVYSLMDNYLDIFNPAYELDNPEAIFVTRYSNVGGAGNNINQLSLNVHPSFKNTNPWGGFVVTADLVNSYLEDDARFDVIVVDTLKDDDGNVVTTGNVISGEVEPVVHNRDLTDINRTGFFDGARLLKWPEDPNISAGSAGNDFIIIRFTEAYTMRAEAYLRTGNETNALTDINAVRARAFEAEEPLVSLDLDLLLEELGKEFLFEAHRRTDLIRFGKWNDPWQFKLENDPIRKLFPIPQVELDANPNLTQNPGY
ncbi:RagB/SusD family nutrient uptake outer membrane protein [Zobellia uliginosa]|uniref:RagB/SusD family nutrient uptake outer membrane protein n=1 Tax=Zobellia uliginosa TaxID=143224 RepID=UPI0026E1C614|nr:RagB/SusD family nutrient uptake outer membrane protein [Zobellia uliginosa]MDO6519560.1 RagB/SusD family nutrient uptake outer membrane protein [Zobellia uliginosa]